MLDLFHGMSSGNPEIVPVSGCAECHSGRNFFLELIPSF